jgi:ribosome maturation factor RimP
MSVGDNSPLFYYPNLLMITKEQIQSITEQSITAEQFIVEIIVHSNNSIFVAIDGYNGVSIDDCVKLSRAIESSFDREVEDFELEVSSAGLSEPFRVIEQYKKNIDKSIDILLKDGSKLAAKLVSVTDTGINVLIEKSVKIKESKKKQIVRENKLIELEDIKHSKLILSFK